MGIMSYVPKLFGYGYRALKLAPEFLIGTGSEAVGQGIRSAGKGASLWTKVKAGGRALEADIAKKALKGGFFKRTFKELLSTPKAVLTSGKAGARLASMTGKSAAAGALKGGFKAIGKRMPVIGAVLTVALEAPNIVKAFKEGGFSAGMKEVGGAGVELGCMAGGAAIGSAICPGIGTAIGGIVGGIVGMFVRGKTYSDKKAEEEAQTQAQTQGATQYSDEEVQALRQYGLSDEEIALAQQNGYSIQDIQQLLAMQNQEYIAPQDNTRVENPYTQEITELERQNQELRRQLEQNGISQQQPAYPAYQNPYLPGLYNPYMNGLYYNNYMPGGYTNDIMYQQLFGTPTNTYDPYALNTQNFQYTS